MDIPINAKVYCQDKLYGQTEAVILNPIKDIVTHVVVKENEKPHTKRLIPIDMIDTSRTDNVHLKPDESMLKSLPTFFDVEYIKTTVPRYMKMYDMVYMDPVVVPKEKIIQEKLYHTPKNELAVSRGTAVVSAHGVPLGKVDEFLIDEDEGHVTHLILREGHIFEQKDVFIPVTEIESISEDHVSLKLDQEDIDELPTIPVRRVWS